MRAHALAAIPLLPLLALATTAHGEIRAGERFPLCTPYTFPEPRLEPPPPGAVSTESDTLELSPDGISTLSGDVALRDEERHLEAATLRIDEPGQTMRAEGPIRYWDDTLVIEGTKARADERAGTTRFSGARYVVPEQHARGEAEYVERLPDGRTRLTGASYTTCDPGDEHWRLNASRVTLNHDSGRGYARNVRLRFMHVPFFYTPWLSFPITDERMTGLLAPTLDLDTDRGALIDPRRDRIIESYDITLPIYLNLAANYDATLSPRFMDERGFLLGLETRYLTEKSRGIWRGEQINDKIFDERRYSYYIDHRTKFSQHWQSSLELEGVSDEDYIRDLDNGFGGSLDRYHRRTGELSFNDTFLEASTRVESYQPIVPETPTPYQRMPQVLWTVPGNSDANTLNWDLEGEFVNFESNHESITGQREDYILSGGYPIETPATFLKPGFQLRHTAYSLDYAEPLESTQEESFSRTLPVYTVDTGIFLERQLDFPVPLIQTLEPRLYYVEVPFEEQDHFPVFDTGARTSSISNMFEPERFTGPDRVGDQHQLTTAVTSRFIGRNNGLEHLSLSGAQIRYFSDREVQLPGEEPEILPRSDFAGEMKADWGNWSGTASLLIDPETERTREKNFRIEYNEQSRRLFNLGYRERVADLEERTFSTRQATASSIWAWNNRWHSIVHAQYDIEGGFLRQGLFGFGYDSCCWSTRFVARNYRQTMTDEPDRGVFLELGLKGMTTLGGRLDDALQDAILGYQPRAQ